MKITRISMVSGIERTFDLNITDQQYNQFANQGMHIQDAMPHLTDDEREFILTGITAEEWEDTFGDEEEYIAEEEPAF